jgi:membrane protease YdiL (CAAX protease family)
MVGFEFRQQWASVPDAVSPEFLSYANPRRFFVLALGISWLTWVPLAVSGLEPFSMPGILLFALGGLGPAAAELVLILRTAEAVHVRDYWERVLDPRRIELRWALLIVCFFPVVNSLSLWVSALLNGTDLELLADPALFADPVGFVVFAGFILLFGPLPEELGWRGYALDGLQARWNALAASVILGVLWAVWHLPLFAMDGSFQHQLGWFTPLFWVFSLGLVFQSILYTWIYNNTNRSTLSAILFHFMTNLSGEVMGLDGTARIVQFWLMAGLAVLVTLVWGPGTLRRR